MYIKFIAHDANGKDVGGANTLKEAKSLPWFRHRMQDGQYEVQKWMPNDWNGLLGNWTPCKRPKGTPEL